MINYTTGNLLASDKEALVNTVNLDGFMGKGIAYQFKRQFPKNNEAYIKACKNNEIGIGKLFPFKEDEKIIINFPTKDKWREKTKIEYIESGLASLKDIIQKHKITSIAIPPLGCGNGGLSWGVVKPIIEKRLKDIQDNIDILIYEPAKDFLPPVKSAPKTTMSHLLVLACIKNLGTAHPLAIQKALFFTMVFAKSNFFNFIEYKHGPYSHPIEIVLREVNEFLDFYNFSSKGKEETYSALNFLYKKMLSKKIEEQSLFYAPFLKKSCYLYIDLIKAYGKKDANKKIEIIATITHILQKAQSLSEKDIIDLFFKYPKEDISIFKKEEIMEGINILEQKNIIEKDLLDNYSIQETFIL